MLNGTCCGSGESPNQQCRRFGKMFWAVGLIVVAAGIVIALEVKSGMVSKVLVGMIGPPKVTLQESFADNPGGAAFDHSPFDELLKANVDENGWVDYGQLKSTEDSLDRYIAAIGKADIDQLGRDERLAFLINSYNAFTLKLIVEKFPLESIKDIPDAERWDAVRWNAAGKKVSLNQIEHELIRPNFKEPRIHFALVCAAVGCPPLRNEAFTGQKLEGQLAGQAEFVHKHKTWFDYSKLDSRLRLTQLYNWYGDDFVQVAGAVEKFAGMYVPELQRDLETGAKPAISWLDYDWALNDKANKSPR